MPLRSIPVPSLVGGITQQPDAIARADRVAECENFLPYPEIGLSQRPGTRRIGQMADNPFADIAMQGIDLGDENDRYIMSLMHKSVRIHTTGGDELLVRELTRDSDGAITGGSVPDFAYLDLKRPNQVTNGESFGSGWTLNDIYPGTSMDMASVSANTGPQTPLGWRDAGGSSEPSQYSVLTMNTASPIDTGSISYDLTGGLLGTFVKVSCYFNTNVTGDVIGDNGAGGVSLVLTENETSPSIYTNIWGITFSWADGLTSPPVVSVCGKFQGGTDDRSMSCEVEQLGENDFRVGFILDTSRAGVMLGSLSKVGIFASSTISGTTSKLNVWGFQVETAGESGPNGVPKLGDYASDPHVLKPLTVVDTTFVSNPRITVEPDITALSPTKMETFGDWDHFATTGTASQLFNVGYIFLKIVSVNETIRYKLHYRKLSDDTLNTIQGTYIVGTVNIEIETAGLVADINSTITAAGGNADDILHASVIQRTDAVAEQSVIVIRCSGDIHTDGFHRLESIDVTDTFSNTLSVGFVDEVESISELPTYAIDGTVVKLVGTRRSIVANDAIAEFTETETPGEFAVNRTSVSEPVVTSVMRFRELTDKETNGAGEFLGGRGVWEEGVDYASVINFQDDTMPIQLIRREDDSAGTVTSVPFQRYFEYAQTSWVDKLVGDDTIAPTPSIISTVNKLVDDSAGTNSGEAYGTYYTSNSDRRINAIAFLRGRMAFVSDQNLVCSEANRFDNLWRTTTRVLPDSDRIDLQASHTEESVLRNIAAIQGRLFLFSRLTTFVLDTGDIFGPKTAGITPVLGSGSTFECKPIQYNGSIIVAPDDGDAPYSQVRAVVPLDQGQVADVVLTDEMPRKLPDDIVKLDAYPELNLLFVLSKDRQVLYALRTVYQGTQILQNAWTELNFKPQLVDVASGIAGITVLNDELFLAMRRGESTSGVGEIVLESMRLELRPQDTDVLWSVALDSRMTELDLTSAPTYSAGPNETTITLPYQPEVGAQVEVTTRTDDNVLANTQHGVPLVVKSVTGASVVLDGDHSSTPLYIGQNFNSKVVLQEVQVREGTVQGGQVLPRTSAVLTVKRGHLRYVDTGYVDVVIDSVAGDGTSTFDVLPPETDDDDITITTDDATPEDGDIKFMVMNKPKDVEVRIENATYKPTNLVGLEWEAEVVTKGRLL